MFDEDRGWLAFWGSRKINLPKQVNGRIVRTLSGLTVIDNCLHKFPQDEIETERGEKFYWMDGFVLNKHHLMDRNGDISWQDSFIKETEKEDFPGGLRGGFSGVISGKESILLFNDHVGNHAVYYYHNNGLTVCATRVYYILELLKYNDIRLQFHVQAAQYMLEWGFMLDDSTFACEIKRVLPGHTVRLFRNGTQETFPYYRMDNHQIKQDITEGEAVEMIDRYFRQAVKREFEKDREYGYEHLVDLSGGLDSRMVCWVAHDMGYVNQTNITYCREGYLDFQSAQKIAMDLRHQYLYMPLDDFKWYRDAEEMSRKNNGASLYIGITGGNRCLKMLCGNQFGIEHTGMAGDVIIGSFFGDAKEGYKRPDAREGRYSDKLHYGIDCAILRKYANKELYLLNTRALLGAQTSYFTRQTYLETGSPFLDVDFLDMMLSIPSYMRCKHHIYLKWLEQKYPLAAEFGWEKWKGMKPKISNEKKVQYWVKLYEKMNQWKTKWTKEAPEHMNPIEYWYEKDRETQQWVKTYVRNKIQLICNYPKLMRDITFLLSKGNAVEKAQAVTVLVWAGFVME